MQRTPQAEVQYGHVRRYYAARLSAPGKAFREAVAEALTDWRLGRASQRVDFSAGTAILGAGVGEIAALRLTALYLPMLHTLGRIQRDIDKIAALSSNRDPYAPRP